jgi:CubicO group peptidase (beta-lactamase class C family)
MIDRDNPAPANVFETVIDEQARIVSVTYAREMPPRLAMWRPVLGCVSAPPGSTRTELAQLPKLRSDLVVPDLDARAWPTGDADARKKLNPAQQRAVDAIVTAAFDADTYGARTWGVVVVKDGKIVAERYAEGYDLHVGEQTHSAAKSFAASIAGVAVRTLGFDLQKAPALEEWNHPADPRRAITAQHLIRMSSGLYGEGNGSPLLDIYNGGGTVAGRAATNMLDTLPGTRFLYNPPDTMLLMRAVRQRVNDDARYLELPFTGFFWKIGMTRTVTSSDWNGDFQMSGQTYSTARDFARFGLLYLNDGVWNSERILPEGWSKYVATQGPAQPSGNGPRYGAQFWIYGGIDGLPPDAYSPSGGLGQYAMIVPSQNVVVVRRGHDPASGGFRIARFSADILAALMSGNEAP